MSGSRSTPPLFDLIRPSPEQEVKPIPPARPAPAPAARAPVAPPPRPAATPPPPSKPVVRLETAPRPAAAPVAQIERPPAARTIPALLTSGRTVRVSVIWLWLAIPAVLASWLIVWVLAHQSGQSFGERLDRFDPSAAVGAGSVQANPSTQEPVLPRDRAETGAPFVPAPAREQEPKVAAAPPADTRQAGHNYLLCASQLDRASAEAAVAFLTLNGVSAIAVPSNKGQSGGKYTVYTLLGIPSDSFNEKLKVRNDHKAEVARLGQTWRRERPGSPDFSDALWEKYKP